MTQPKNYLAVKSNTLIRQRTNLSLAQQKIVLFLIQAIDFDDNKKGEFKNSYKVDIKEFINLEENKFRYVNRKQFVDIAVADYLRRQKKVKR